MFYLDSSLVVALLTAEPDSDRVEAWIAGQAADALAASDWVTVEVSAALAAKLRSGAIDASLRQQALDALAGMRAGLSWLGIGTAHFATAARLAADNAAKLRAGDALHLALAVEHGATLATLDKRQAEAGAALGIATTIV